MHYVLIDNHSGFVWGEADAATPIEACRIVDENVGGEPREYNEDRFSCSTISGYHVYEAPDGWARVRDGQSQSEIQRVESMCRKVAEVSFRTITD